MSDWTPDERTHVRRAITINRSPEDVASFWRRHAQDAPGDDALVRFIPAPGGRGTEVHLERSYTRPGRIASVIAAFRHELPDQKLFDELFALKQILETGDIVLSDAWVNGASSRHPAQPDPQASQAATARSRTDTSEIGGSAA